jgi:hypothetical protein
MVTGEIPGIGIEEAAAAAIPTATVIIRTDHKPEHCMTCIDIL